MTKIDLITGFLGAGKTTLLLKYGQYLKSQGVSFAIIENDFGSSAVDTLLLKQAFDGIYDVSGGCICCSLTPSFVATLVSLAPKFDRIVIEPSGIFELNSFMSIINAAKNSAEIELGMCVTVVDPLFATSMDGELKNLLKSMLVNTGRIVWSKTDLYPDVDLDKKAGELSSMIDSEVELGEFIYPVPTCELGDGDFAELMSAKQQNRISFIKPQACTALFNSFGLPVKGTFGNDSITELINSIMEDSECGKVLRVKGVFKNESGKININYTAGEKITFKPCNTSVTTNLVFIGERLELSKIYEKFKVFKEKYIQK